MRKRAPYRKIGAVSAVHKGYYLAYHVDEELRMHAGRANAAYLLFINIKAYGRARRLFHLEHGR